MNNDASDIQASQAVSLVSLQIQIGEIKGILQTIVAEHARRLTDLDDVTKQLRNDITLNKEVASRELALLREAVQNKWDEGAKQGQNELTRINKELNNLENGRRENREDIQEIRDRQNQSWPRIVSIMSALASVGLFILALVYR